MSTDLIVGRRVRHSSPDPAFKSHGLGVLQRIVKPKTAESEGLASVLFDTETTPRLVLICDLSPIEPLGGKLSAHIADCLGALAATDNLTPTEIDAIVDFHRRSLPHLQVFASDIEFAEMHKGTPHALSLAAAAALRFYRRLGRPLPDLVPIADTPAPLIDLDRFRRPPA